MTPMAHQSLALGINVLASLYFFGSEGLKYTTKTPDAVLPQLFFASLVATIFIVSTH